MRFLAAALLAIAATASAQPPTTVEEQIARRVQADVEFLASDALEGRDTGSKGYRIAADYVASQFRAIGLQPAADWSLIGRLGEVSGLPVTRAAGSSKFRSAVPLTRGHR